MTETSSNPQYILVYNEKMSKEFRSNVVRFVLDNRKNLAIPQYVKLIFEKALLNSRIKLNRFRNNEILQAPSSLLELLVINKCQILPQLFVAILNVWVCGNTELLSVVKTFYNKRNRMTPEKIVVNQTLTDVKILDELNNFCEDFNKEFPIFDKDEVALMLFCIGGTLKEDFDVLKNVQFSNKKNMIPKIDKTPEKKKDIICQSEINDNTEQPSINTDKKLSNATLQTNLVMGTCLDTILSDLRNLPADSTEWKMIEDFISQVRTITEQKKAELEQGINKLQSAIDELCECCAGQLQLFECETVELWQAKNCPSEKRGVCIENILKFQNLLSRHCEIDQKISEAKKITEKKTLRVQLGTLEEEITGIYDILKLQLINNDDTPPISPNDGDDGNITTNEIANTEEYEPIEQSTCEATAAIINSEPFTSDSEIAGKIPEDVVDVDDDNENTVDITEETFIDDIVPTPPPVNEKTTVVKTPESIESDENKMVDVPKSSDDITESTGLLRSSKEIATIISNSGSTDFIGDFCWSLIAEEDVPTAYNLAIASEKEGLSYQHAIKPWLLSALQGSLWLSPGSDLFVEDLRSIAFNNSDTIIFSKEESAIALSAAMRATLLAPTCDLQDWLHCPTKMPALAGTVNAIEEFTRFGIVIQPEDLYEAFGSEQRESAIKAVVNNTKNWLENATKHRSNLLRAVEVWRHLIGPKGELNALLQPVCKDQRELVNEVRMILNKWSNKKELPDIIQNIDRKLAGPKSREIVGVPRDQLIGDIIETVGLAKQWCDYVEREAVTAGKVNWKSEHVNNLRKKLKETLPDAEAFLHKMLTESNSMTDYAVYLCLARSCADVRDILSMSPSELNLPKWETDKFFWLLKNADSLEHALLHQLLMIPEVTISSKEKEDEIPYHDLILSLCKAYANGRTLEMVFDLWIEKKDFRFIERILDAMPDKDSSDIFMQKYSEELEGARCALREEMSEALITIEQAVVDGIITEEDRSKYCGQVEKIDVDETRNFFEAKNSLDTVLFDLDNSRVLRLDEQKRIWNEFMPRLIKHLHNMPDNQRDSIINFVQVSLDNGDTRVVDECISRLREATDQQTAIEDTWFGKPDDKGILRDFQMKAPLIQEWFKEEHRNNLKECVKLINNDGTIAGIHFGNISPLRRKDITDVIDSWRLLKQNDERHGDVINHIEKLVRFLGFQFKFIQGRTIQKVNGAPGWMHARASMSASDLARPIPQFGTQSNNSYDIMCLWERPGADTIGAFLHEQKITVRNFIVFYLGRLTEKQRKDLLNESRKRDLAITVFDETMLVYLSGESDPSKRLPMFLKCSLPYATINPYTIAGEVPEEMFFGRDEYVADLINPSGSCIVYGGRQLGKSSLLRHVEKIFHNQNNDQYAIVNDIRNIIDTRTSTSTTSIRETDAIWGIIGKTLHDLGLVLNKVSSSEIGVTRQIKNIMTDSESSHRRILLMFDEADAFLNADSEDNFRIVVALREIMKSTQNRFKVIFAGLNSVQRFQAIPNHPLAQFKAPIRVGPIDPRTAQELVRLPLEYLGYRFDGPGGQAAVLRILSYTNYHPGLIQMICEELILKLRRRHTMPPYQVTPRDVEELYSQEVRNKIRDRFELTLNLDDHYKAIAWTMIQDQLAIRDSFAREYAPQNILALVDDWWHDGFKDIDLGTFQGILDEMCGLGILVPVNGAYRLRSPNLVRLMGTTEYIENRLIELSSNKPAPKDDPDCFHSLIEIGKGKTQSNVLTYSQERALNPRQTGVGLILGSEALGSLILPYAIKRFVPADMPDLTMCTTIPSNVDNIVDWLQKFKNQHSHQEQIVLSMELSNLSVGFEQTITSALKFCRNPKKTEQKWMRIVFLLSSHAVWDWVVSLSDVREKIEYDTSFRQTSLKRWAKNGIYHSLRQHDVMNDSDETCSYILKNTGGWPWLLQKIFERCKTNDDPCVVTNNIKEEILQPGSAMRDLFKESLSFSHEAAAPAWNLLQFLYLLGKTARKDITPEILESECDISLELYEKVLEYLKIMGLINVTFEDNKEFFEAEPVAGQVLFES